MTGAQAGHKGPSAERTLTGQRRLHPVQISWLAGSVTRQCGHNGRPCSSRIATCWTAPHRAHGWKRDLATQLRHDHCPPIRRCRLMTRPHRGHGGRTILVAPASHSSLISLSTDGTGARGARSGEQPGLVLQCPGELTALPGPCSRRRHRGGHERGRQRWIDGRHDVHHDLGRVLAAHRAGIARTVAARPGHATPPCASCRRQRRAGEPGRRRRSTSPVHGAAWCAGPCRIRCRPAAAPPGRPPCAARSAGPRRPAAPATGHR